MKKIIYSLVIMIAAGSLFTSCIEQVEPEGIKNLRDAKAEYIRALKDLRAADAEFQRASAEVQRAEAALRQAQADKIKAETECYVQMQALERRLAELQLEAATEELKALKAEIAAEIEGIELSMEEIRAQHEINMVGYQEDLAKAEEALRHTLRDIALASQDLTANEKAAVKAAIDEYEAAYNAYVNQTLVVMNAQDKVVKAQEALAKADLVWDAESLEYVNQIDLWEKWIEQDKEQIAEDEALLEQVPDPDVPDLNEWQATLDELQAKKDQAEYSKHSIVEEVAAYYVTYVHDGMKKFNDFIDAWVEENPVVEDPAEALEDDGVTPKYPVQEEPDQADYTIDVSKTMVNIPPFEVDLSKDLAKDVIYYRFGILADEYFGLKSDAKKNKYLAELDGSAAPIIKAEIFTRVELKDFIMGNTEGTPVYATYKAKDGTKYEKVKANYGINGAISVLERELVLAEQSKEPEREAIEKAYKQADSIWRAHRAILLAGFGEFKDYKKAAADSAKAAEELKAAKAAAADGAKGMIAAIDELSDALASVNSAGVSKNDSVRILNAFVAFAKARENLLIYENEGKTAKNYLYYRYCSGKDIKGNWKVDSVKFTDLSFADLAADKYGHEWTTGGVWSSKNWALAHIATELLNNTFANPIKASDGNWDFSGADWNAIIDGHNAFYGEYKYVETPTRKIVAMDGGDITTKAEKDAQDKLDKANAAIAKAKTAYAKIYRAYWNEPAFNYGDPEFNAGCYNEKTFLEPYNIVYFDGDDIVYNEGLGTIVAFVDPKFGGDYVDADDFNDGGYLGTTAIFGTYSNPTTFAKMMKAKQAFDTFGSLTPWKEALEEIKAWRDDVEKAFNDLIAQDGQPDVAAYEEAVEQYAEFVEAKAEYDAYMDALKQLVGVDDEGNPLVADPTVLKIKETKYNTVEKIMYKFANLDVENGVWDDDVIGGDVEKKLNEIFPDFPAKLKVWKDAEDFINDAMAHYQLQIDALMPAYLAAAKAAGYDEGLTYDGTWEDLIAAYQEAREDYINALKQDIKDLNADIADLTKKIADFKSGVPAAELNLASAEATLAKEEFKLAQLADRLAGAEANLKAILEYIGSLDATIVTPVND